MTEVGFWRAAASAPERVALIAPDGTEVSAGELLERSNQVAHGLRALGVTAGDTVTLVVPNGVPLFEVYMGAMQIGCYVTPINHHLVGPEIAYIVADAGTKVLVVDARFEAEASRAITEVEESGFDLPAERRFSLGQVEGCRPYSELIEGHPTTAPDARTAGTAMHYTSGTTGKPKGILHTTGGFQTFASLSAKLVFDLKPEDIFWCTADIGWVTGHTYTVYGPMSNGATQVIYEGVPTQPGPDRMWEMVERYGVTASCAHVLHVVSRIAAPGEFIGLTQDAQSTPAPEHALCIASATVSASRFSHKAKMLGPLPDREQPRAPASRAASFT